MNSNNEVIEPVYIKIYSSYTDAQKQAIQKYRTEHRDKVNELARKQYQARKQDTEFMQKRREYCKQYYQRKRGAAIKQNAVNATSQQLPLTVQ
jgi:hypothetical protein